MYKFQHDSALNTVFNTAASNSDVAFSTGSGTVTLNSYFTEWEQRRRGTVKPSTERRCFSNYHNNISPALGMRHLTSISRRDITGLQQALFQRGLKPSTINMNMATLHTIMRAAVLDGFISVNPCDGVVTIRCDFTPARENIHRALKDDELFLFFNAGQNFTHLPALKLMLLTGMRAGEACALTWGDIDIDNEILRVRHTVSLSKAGYCLLTPKTVASRRDIPLTPRIKLLLSEQRCTVSFSDKNSVNASDSFVFPSRDGSFITPSTLNITIIRILDKLAASGTIVDHFSSHAFRDTFATRAIEAGMKPETLQRILGHSNIMLTMNLYYHLSDEKKRREMQLIQYPDF